MVLARLVTTANVLRANIRGGHISCEGPTNTPAATHFHSYEYGLFDVEV